MYSTAATPPPLRLFSPPLRHRLLVKPSLLLRLLSPPSRSPSLCLCSESLDKGEREWERETKKSARSWV